MGGQSHKNKDLPIIGTFEFSQREMATQICRRMSYQAINVCVTFQILTLEMFMLILYRMMGCHWELSDISLWIPVRSTWRKLPDFSKRQRIEKA